MAYDELGAIIIKQNKGKSTLPSSNTKISGDALARIVAKQTKIAPQQSKKVNGLSPEQYQSIGMQIGLGPVSKEYATEVLSGRVGQPLKSGTPKSSGFLANITQFGLFGERTKYENEVRNALLKTKDPELKKELEDELKSLITERTTQQAIGAGAGGGLKKINEVKVPVTAETPSSTKVKVNVVNEPKLVQDVSQMTPEEQLRSGIQPGEVVKNEKVPTVEIPSATGTATKERGLVSSVKESPNISEEIRAGVGGSYNPIVLRKLKEATDILVQKDAQRALQIVNDATVNTAETNAIAASLVEHLQKLGRFDEAITLINKVAPQATKQGQANAALALFERLTPAGTLRYTDRIYRMIRNEFPNAKVELTPDLAKKLSSRAEEIQALPSGSRARTIATAQLYHQIFEQVPVSAARKISMVQTMAQLLNPKTVIRNLGGNTGYSIGKNIADVIGAGIDSVVGLFTKQRTQTLPSIPTQVRGFRTGLQQGAEDARLGINTSPINTQFEIQQQVFRNRLLKAGEKALNYSLRVPDRAAWQAAYDEAMRNLVAVAERNGTKVGPKQLALMDDQAKLLASEATFQDTNRLTQLFTGIKSALNKFSGSSEFGLGDFILKYPKTPANILARGVEFSPAGFVRSAWELVRPLVGKEFRQGEFVKYTSRAVAGTGTGVVLGATLHRLGIITGKKEDNKAVAGYQRSVGLGQYRLNVSALKRYVLSLFNPNEARLRDNDLLVSYDWFQPGAIAFSIGANVDENKGSGRGIIGTAVNSIAEGTNTLAEQPLVKNLQAWSQGGSFSESLVSSLTGAPASFVPTLLYQIRQLADNVQRNTYNPSPLYTAWNLVQNKIPFLSKKLPASITPTGEEQLLYADGKNTLVNVFLNPAFVSTYRGDAAADMLLGLYQKYGDNQIFPRVVSKTVQLDGKTYQLSGKQISDYQEYIGKIAADALKNVASGAIDEYNDQAKMELLRSTFSRISDSGRLWLLTNLYKSGGLKEKK